MAPPPRKRRLVAVNDLKWKSVALPERLEDAEGFYGLEEIDNVEIVRDPESNRLSFLAAKAASRTESDAPSDAESEWQGFDAGDGGDNDEVEKSDGGLPEVAGGESADESADAAAAAPALDKQQKTKKAKERKKANPKTAISSQSLISDSNGFHHLEDQDDDGGGEDIDVSEWDQVNLSPDMLVALSRMKFSKPTPIQRASIPEAMQGHDVIGKASTGSGKTLAYGIPILEHVASRKSSFKFPAALVLAPTRELAHQISKHLSELSTKLPNHNPRFATITGGLSVHKQQRLLKDADVVIGTPGRLWEVISGQAGVLTALRRIKFLVVDEADRLLSEGHFKEVEEILNSLDRTDVDEEEELNGELQRPKRQTLVFSATFQKGLQRKLAGKSKHSDTSIMSQQESMDYLLEKLNFREEAPQYIDVNPVSQMAQNLREGLLECAANEKDLYLYALLLHHPNRRTLIFNNSISAVRRIAPFLQNLGLQIQGLHSQMPQKARLRAIERFTAHKGSILVATDVAARGLDIPDVDLVLHYHVPRQADVYVHRSGRTARAENAGSSILLCAPDEVTPVRRLVAKIHARNAAKRAGTKFYIRTLDLDRQVVNRLKPRAELAKRIADAGLAKEKHNSEESWLKKAAEDLGVDYDSDEFARADGAAKGGKGKGRREKEAEARAISKQDVARLKAQLKALLAQRVNVGVSERYLSAGGIDIDQLLREEKNGQGTWLGKVDLLGMD